MSKNVEVLDNFAFGVIDERIKERGGEGKGKKGEKRDGKGDLLDIYLRASYVASLLSFFFFGGRSRVLCSGGTDEMLPLNLISGRDSTGMPISRKGLRDNVSAQRVSSILIKPSHS